MTEPTPHAQKKKHSRQMATSCESCGNFVYDEDYECYTCEVDLDEDVGRQCVRYTKLRRLR